VLHIHHVTPMQSIVTRRVFIAIVATSLVWFLVATLYVLVLSPSTTSQSVRTGRKLVSRLGEGKDSGPVALGPQDDVEKQTGYTRFGFNQLLSSKIPLDRAVPDARDPLLVSVPFCS
jgi:hypothetical protein